MSPEIGPRTLCNACGLVYIKIVSCFIWAAKRVYLMFIGFADEAEGEWTAG